MEWVVNNMRLKTGQNVRAWGGTEFVNYEFFGNLWKSNFNLRAIREVTMDCGRNQRGGCNSQEFWAFFKGTWIIKKIRTVLTQSTKSILYIKKVNMLFTVYFLLEEDEDLALTFFYSFIYTTYRLMFPIMSLPVFH